MALRIKMDLCSGGDWDHPDHIGTLLIANDGTGDPQVGNYNIVRGEKRWRVEGHRRAEGAWELLRLAIGMEPY